jgi:hypothetical protein
MLFQTFVELAVLVMAEIAWFLRVGIALTCLIILFAVSIAAISFAYNTHAKERVVPRGHRPGPLPQS